MRKTNKWKRGGTAMMIAAGLGLTSAGLSTATEDALETAAITVEDSAKSALSVEATHASDTGFAPMRLRFSARLTPSDIMAMEQYRKAALAGDKAALQKLGETSKLIAFKRRFQITINDHGEGSVELSEGQGGWPGYVPIARDWIKRAMSDAMANGIRDIAARCAGQSMPEYFFMELTDGDADVSQEAYEIECLPGREAQRAKVSELDLAKAYLVSDDLPLERRQQNIQHRIPHAIERDYILTTPHATIEMDRAKCLEIAQLMTEKYEFRPGHRTKNVNLIENHCPTTDYNYRRRRHNLPDAQ